ncbi:MAG: nucleotide exchange factor GrpE [Rhizobiales bacterium TMED94]|nr:nucleotide exchange factor GrpE [Rhodobiaceae bacterium]RPF85580.1 MAG: nucleotide exchange factor GrpE [Rhizobiales bacterium TMED94]|tara:strand:+ start:71 stop:607 length:537 start_codon:yes stop_codon:yes gene_type:complete
MEEEKEEQDNKVDESLVEEENEANNQPEEISLEDKVKELEDRLLRSAAEVENIRKRSEKERSEAYKIGISLFVKDFVPVLDNIERALASLKDSDEINYESFVEGISATEKDIISLLEKHGIQQINPINEKFDPLFHEALFEAESDDHEPGFVTQVIEVGYVIDKRLIRAAKVGVASKK